MNFDYNTQRKRMALPEYGRNVQKMVEYVKTIEDREERTRAAKTVIMVMANLNNTHFKDEGDFKHKLWDHLALIADFDLDIDAPYPQPEPSKFQELPKQVPYVQGGVKFLHYGRIVEMMINAAVEMENNDDKEYLISLIVNQMKKSYITWNRSQVADEVILADMKNLSKGRLEIPSDIKILEAKELVQPVKKKPILNNKNHGKQNKQHPYKKKQQFRH